MISHKYKCIFIHIPKCAGTSIEKVLGHFDDFDGRGGQDHRSLRLLVPKVDPKNYLRSKGNFFEGVRKLKYSLGSQPNPQNKVTVNQAEYENYFKFSFVRNPWARAFSWYKNAIRDKVHRELLQIEAEITFQQFLERFIGKGFLKPQTYWLEDFNGEVSLDFVGKFESLHEDFHKVCEHLDLGEIKLPHAVKGDSGSCYREAYNDELIQLVADFYAKEIKLFDYEF
jgi:hypothetical protein